MVTNKEIQEEKDRMSWEEFALNWYDEAKAKGRSERLREFFKRL